MPRAVLAQGCDASGLAGLPLKPQPSRLGTGGRRASGTGPAKGIPICSRVRENVDPQKDRDTSGASPDRSLSGLASIRRVVGDECLRPKPLRIGAYSSRPAW